MAGSLSDADWVTLNVGGRRFGTLVGTLRSHHESLLARMFAEDGQLPLGRDADGCFVLDRDATAFSFLLNYLRTGKVVRPDNRAELEALRIEAEYFALPDLAAGLQAEFSRSEVVRLHASVDRLKLGGASLVGIDMSGLSLFGCVFDHCDLTGASVADAVLNSCSFNKARLTSAVFDRDVMPCLTGSNLDGASFMSCNLGSVNLRGVSARGCCFDHALVGRTEAEGAMLDNSTFRSIQFGSNHHNFRNAQLNNVDFSNARLGADRLFADFSGAVARSANFSGVIRGPRTMGVKFKMKGADLTGADFSNTDLTLFDFTDAVGAPATQQ